MMMESISWPVLLIGGGALLLFAGVEVWGMIQMNKYLRKKY